MNSETGAARAEAHRQPFSGARSLRQQICAEAVYPNFVQDSLRRGLSVSDPNLQLDAP